MIEFLAMQIRLGKITLDQVPERFREQVRLVLEEEDYPEEEET